MARKTTASSAVIESKELRSYRLARTISLIAVIALIVWLLRGSLVGKAFKAAAASGAGPIGYLAWALYALSAVFILSAPLLLLHHVSFSRLYRSALERSTFPAGLGLTYWRETLPTLRPACISMLADLEIEPKKDAAAQLLRLEMQGLIRVVERNGAPVAEVVDQAAESFTESDRVLVDIAWIFFRVGFMEAVAILKIIFGFGSGYWFTYGGNLAAMGIIPQTMNVLIISFAVLLGVDLCRYHRFDLIGWICRQGAWLRWLIYYAGIFAILVYGAYGAGYDASQFLYFQF